ncbi:MAG: hypothetical protein ACRD2W_00530 [Acidimicrobiales bacterium]
MATESFLVTALPYSASADEPFHVSLFVSHRLTPDGAQGELSDFPHVADWTAMVADPATSFRLRGGLANGTTVDIPVVPVLGIVDPGLWRQVFPPDFPVRPWKVPNHTAVPWRTFPAHRMQQHALFAHAASIVSSPVVPPSAKGSIFADLVLRTFGLDKRELPLEAVIDGRIDTIVTRQLDRLIVSGKGGINSTVGSSAESPVARLIADVELARRYYQRPEEQRPYSERPVPGATAVPVAKPEPDFHERAGMLGDLSPLLRRLGLVIDLRVEKLALLNSLVWLQGDVLIPSLPNPIRRQPRVACRVLGTSFTANSASGDFEVAMLRLGDEDRFTVLDLDPDASGLKLEQFVRNVPRILAAENNGDAENAAPGSLRATGFGIARPDRAVQLHDRVDGAAAKDAAVVAGNAPPLSLEQVSRGIRVEVWDDVSGDWHSLHKRLLTVDIDGAGRVLDGVPDTGFLQGAALTHADGQPAAPKHAHEVLAGWEGWSLAAPRPGNVVVHDGGDEQVLAEPPPDPSPVNPVASSGMVAPGTLPRLRYGRSYAFRAYAADLAGNSPPHAVAEPPGPGPVPAAGKAKAKAKDKAEGDREPERGRPPFDEKVAAAQAERLLRAKPPEATAAAHLDDGPVPIRAARQQLHVLRPLPVEGPARGDGVAGIDPGGVKVTGVREVDELVAARLTSTAKPAFAAGADRRARIETAFTRVTHESAELLRRTDVQTSAGSYGAAMSSFAGDQVGLLAAVAVRRGGLSIADFLAMIGSVITTPRPFLRWDPVIEPATVPRHAYTEGESLLRLVIRSGVEQAAPGDLELTVVPPDTYAAQAVAAHPGLDLQWREDSQRHLAAPKTSQFEAELHGAFDAAIGNGSPADVRSALGIALRESGTFFDVTVADVANPGQRVAQPNVSFVVSPTADAPDHATPGDLPRGVSPTPGQYVVHDVDTLVLPYLPDPLAVGVSFTFPDAGHDHLLTGLLALEGTAIRYPDAWPSPMPLRLVLEAGPELTADVDGQVVRMTVPPGEHLRMRMSSCLDRASLDLLGLWRSQPAATQADEVVAEAAADGWLWWLTPSVEVRLVHAVPRPVEVPRPTLLVPWRAEGDTQVVLYGAVDVHGPSTDRIDMEATWTEWVDDVAKPEPEEVTVEAAAFGTSVSYEEDLVALYKEDDTTALPDGSSFRLHAAVHKMGDTRHRDVDYRVRATTRYKEYFSPQVTPSADDLSVVGPVRRIDVPSSARPTKVVVRDVLPLFRWDERTEPSQPFGLRRTRRAGLRVYLDRPWYTTGNGELLGVVLSAGSDVAVPGSVSQWGGDPVWLQQGPTSRAALPLVDLMHLFGLDDRPLAARPVGRPVSLPLVDVAGRPEAWVLGYQPEFSAARNLWFVDIAFDPATAFWPFVRLAVARYQPSSLDGLHLGPVHICDYAQLAPERTATLTRPDDGHARVIVTGPVGVPQVPIGPVLVSPPFASLVALSRVVRARLEQRDPSVGTDLGWVTVSQQDLPILGAAGPIITWSGQVELPSPVPPQTPGTESEWRVTVEEWERLPADPLGRERPGFEERIVYADHFPL